MLGKNRRFRILRPKQFVRKKIEGSTAIPAIIGLLGIVVGTLLAQRMNATTETDKVVRVKLEEAYYRTLTLVNLADDLNMAAASEVIQSNYVERAQQYNFANIKYREEITRIVAITDLYEEKLSPISEQLTACGNNFSSAAGGLFLFRAKLGGIEKIMMPNSNSFDPNLLGQSLNNLVAIKLGCNDVATKMRKGISSVMKSHS